MEPSKINATGVDSQIIPGKTQPIKKSEETKTTARDSSATSQKSIASQARFETPELSLLSFKEILKLDLDPKALPDKDRFQYELVHAYSQSMNEIGQAFRKKSVDYQPIKLDFRNANLEGLDVSKILEGLKELADEHAKSGLFNIRRINNLLYEADKSTLSNPTREKMLFRAATENISVDLRGSNLREANFSNFLFSYDSQAAGVDFTGANLSGCAFWNHYDHDTEESFDKYAKDKFAGAIFDFANLNRVNLAGTDLRGLSFVGANLRYASLGLSKLAGANMKGADLTGAFITFGSRTYNYEEHLQASGQVYDSSEMIQDIPVDFLKTMNDFTNMNLSFAKLGTNFMEGNLTGAQVFGVRVDTADYNQEASGYLPRPEWMCDMTTGEELDQSYIQQTFMDFLVMLGANPEFIPQDLAGLDLRDRDLSDLDLSNLDLRNVDARGVNFTKAKLDGAQIAGMKIDDKTKINDMQIDSSHEGRRLNSLDSRNSLSRLVRGDKERVASQGIFIR